MKEAPRPGARLTLIVALALAAAALRCGKVHLKAADQASRYKVEAKASTTVQAPEGFRAVLVAEGLNYPSSLTRDSEGQLYVLESGTVPIPTLSPKILRARAGRLEEVPLTGGFPGAEAVGLVFHERWLYFSHEEKEGTWGVSRVRPRGEGSSPSSAAFRRAAITGSTPSFSTARERSGSASAAPPTRASSHRTPPSTASGSGRGRMLTTFPAAT
ncbi:MAG: hypothetical protein ABJC61_00665 [Acidobacteriota bacterium]